MKHRAYQVGALLAFMLAWVPTALAGPLHPVNGDPARRERASQLNGRVPYHNGATLLCSDCHVMHASMQHNYQGGTGPEGGVPSFPFEPEPSPKLLKAPDPVDLCLSCHDNVSGIPDVVGSDANGLSERSGGLLEPPGIHNPRGHNLGRGLDTTPGQGACFRCHFGGDPATAEVTCIDCHNPHGNGNQRNLQWASAPEFTPPFGLFVNEMAEGMSAYERENVAYGTSNSVDLLEVTSMCIDCHHVFSGGLHTDPDGDDIHSRHPAYDSERDGKTHIADGGTRGSTAPAHWMGGTGSGFEAPRVPFVVDGATNYTAARTISSEYDGVFCLSCHKAHGSSEAFGLVWPVDGQVDRVACDQCHDVAGGGGDPSASVVTMFGR